MKKPRKLSVIREDITVLRGWIRRAEQDGVNWHKIQEAKRRLTELQTEEFRAMGGKSDEPGPGAAA